jgi:hypothetical protein
VSRVITLHREARQFGPDGHAYLRYWNIKGKREAVLPIPPALSEQLDRHEALLRERYPAGTAEQHVDLRDLAAPGEQHRLSLASALLRPREPGTRSRRPPGSSSAVLLPDTRYDRGVRPGAIEGVRRIPRGRAYSVCVEGDRRAARAALVVLCVLVSVGGGAVGVPPARAGVASVPGLTVYTDQLAGPPLMGLGVELDPYDTVAPDQINWPLLSQRLEFMRPGFVRVTLGVAYCVAGGGQLAVVFPRRGGVSLIATTARGYRLGGIGPGTTVPSLRRRYPRGALRAVGRRLLVTPAGWVFIVRSGRVTALALIGRSVLAKPGALQAAVRLAALDDLGSRSS